MYWPTKPNPVPLNELGWVNTLYLANGGTRCDPTIVWGTTVETDSFETFLAEQRRRTGMLLSPAHLLVRAVAESLRRHPLLNRRVVGRRVYQYDGVHVVMPMLQTRDGEVDVIFLRHAEAMSLADVARHLWDAAREKSLAVAARERQLRERPIFSTLSRRLWQRFRLGWMHAMSGIGFAIFNRLRIPTLAAWQCELNGANAFVNYLGFPGAPPMVSYKPSGLPTNSFSVSVTMGPTEPRAVVVDNEVVVRRQASLFIRVDHRMVNGHQAAGFISTLRGCLTDPWSLVAGAAVEEKRAA